MPIQIPFSYWQVQVAIALRCVKRGKFQALSISSRFPSHQKALKPAKENILNDNTEDMQHQTNIKEHILRSHNLNHLNSYMYNKYMTAVGHLFLFYHTLISISQWILGENNLA